MSRVFPYVVNGVSTFTYRTPTVWWKASKRLAWIVLFLFLGNHLYSATYAVIVGIAKYQDEGISSLKYSSRDAKMFSDYLQSDLGGNVPEENIRLLTDSLATYPAIYNSLQWLTEVAQENDLVYFYFSGHGDIENVTLYKLGFLITYNTFRNNYMFNAVSVDHLNYYANTLSAVNKAKVVIITDACHSGKLAGSAVKGNKLVAQQLQQITKSEIRFTSCTSDQVSYENEKWDNGRGVFSYYFLRGLKGCASRKDDTTMTLSEFKTYLESELNRDGILNEMNVKQTPVIKGREDFKFNVPSKDKASDCIPLLTSVSTLPPLPPTAQSYFFTAVKAKKLRYDEDIETVFNLRYLDALPVDSIPSAMMAMLAKKDTMGNFGWELGEIVDYRNNMSALAKGISGNKFVLSRFKESLVTMLTDRGDELINLYLAGDEQELERQRYYNAVKSDYALYAIMYSLALKLTVPSTPLKEILTFKKYFFQGFAAQLAIPQSKNQKGMMDYALKQYSLALEIKQNAPYVHNNMGILYSDNKEIDKAKQSFNIARELAPTWVIPYNNLANLYTYLNLLDSARSYLDEAKKIDSNNYGYIVREALWYEKKGNYLFAEEYFNKAIERNARHFLPFERLAYTYLQTDRFDKADSLFDKADSRKKGFNFKSYEISDALQSPGPRRRKDCFANNDIDSTDPISVTIKGQLALQDSDYAKAETFFKSTLAADRNNPIAHYYLCKALSGQERFAEAERELKDCLRHYINKDAFDRYVDSAKAFITEQHGYDNKQCLLEAFQKLFVTEMDIRLFLANVYTNRSNYADAEKIYRESFLSDKEDIKKAAYESLINLYERQGRYTDAEFLITTFQPKPEEVNKNLASLYTRILDKRAPAHGSPDLNYRAGCFFYQYFKRLNIQDSCDMNYRKMDQDIRLAQSEHPCDEEKRKSKSAIRYPRISAIYYLRRADSLHLSSPEELADCNSKLGDLYSSMNRSDSDYIVYSKAADLNPSNPNYIMLSAKSCDAAARYQRAKSYLDYLWQSNLIADDQLGVLAHYNILVGNYTIADSILRIIQTYSDELSQENEVMYGNLYWLAKDYPKSISSYQKYLTLHPKDYKVLYALARLYYVSGDSQKSWDTLISAVDSGWPYARTMSNDPTWIKLRKNGRWSKLMSKLDAQAKN